MNITRIINENINNGAGFLNYVGHGYTDSIGTSSPHGIEHMSYSLSDINALSNDYRLPICFFDACLTGKIDYDILDKLMLPLISLYPTPFMHFMKRILDSIETQIADLELQRQRGLISEAEYGEKTANLKREKEELIKKLKFQ